MSQENCYWLTFRGQPACSAENRLGKWKLGRRLHPGKRRRRWTKQAVGVMGGGSASLFQAEPMGMGVRDKR